MVERNTISMFDFYRYNIDDYLRDLVRLDRVSEITTDTMYIDPTEIIFSVKSDSRIGDSYTGKCKIRGEPQIITRYGGNRYDFPFQSCYCGQDVFSRAWWFHIRFEQLGRLTREESEQMVRDIVTQTNKNISTLIEIAQKRLPRIRAEIEKERGDAKQKAKRMKENLRTFLVKKKTDEDIDSPFSFEQQKQQQVAKQEVR